MALGRGNKSIYKPLFPEKYKGDSSNIIARSSWERKFFKWADLNPAVLEWSSEELIIPYVSPIDGRRHRYFPDIQMKVADKYGEIKTYVVEIKPFKQTLPPKVPNRKTKQFLAEVATYGVNQAKWAAAREYCKNRGYEFVVLTEKELGIR